MKWTNHMRDRLIAMHKRGDSFDDIAYAFETTYHAIKHQVARLRQEGLLEVRINGEWTEADDQQLKQLRKEGKAYSEIGAIMGRARGACVGRMHRLMAGVGKPTGRPSSGKIKPAKEWIDRPAYKVHPMWSMPEDERRLAFYEKFQQGWAEVQERLNA